ncbi:MAG: cadmium-translocating P-type ATPase [Planctomycetota bacterium]|nr:MAG: cadmium-translocating P-type ATPase [Planctomycetota bacterium]
MFELPVLNQNSTPPTSRSGRKARFLIEGMHCAGCVGRAETGLRAVPGVLDAQVNLANREAQVTLSEDAPEPNWTSVLAPLGYQFRPLPDATTPPESPPSPIPWIISLSFSALVMWLCTGGGHWPGAHRLAAGLSAFVVFGFGREFYRIAWTRWQQRTSDMNTLIALGSGVAYIAGLVELGLHGAGHAVSTSAMPFDAAAMIVSFVLLGRWLEARARQRASRAIDELGGLIPQEAVLLRRDNTEVIVPLAQVCVADRLLVRPGSRLPVDGRIESGRADLDESLLTGESLPVSRGPGDSVLGGSLCHGGSLVVQAEQVGDATTLGQIIGLVRDAQGTKAPIARLADRIARVFVPSILGLALTTSIAWLILATGPDRFARTVQATVNVLVIACPCALGLATPVAVVVAMGRAAREGLLIRDGEALETLGKVSRVAFDKTGTLTIGQPHVIAWEGLDQNSETALSAARAVAQLSEHPLSGAIVTWIDTASGAPAAPLPVSDFQSIPGQGIHGTVAGQNIRLERDPLATPDQPGTRTALFIDNQRIGSFVLQDQLRPEAAGVIAALRTLGIQTALLTGDRKAVAQQVAREVTIDDPRAELHPGDKGSILRDWQSHGEVVAMVGDGINDAPALAIANVGMALGSGTAVAMATADVTVLSGSLRGVVDAILLSRQTLHVIRQNLGFAIGYNLVGIPLAAGLLYPWTGWLLPSWFAAAAMSSSSVCVVLNSLRLGRRPDQRQTDAKNSVSRPLKSSLYDNRTGK